MRAAPTHGDEAVLLVVHKHWAVFVPEVIAVTVPTALLIAALFLPASVLDQGLRVIFTFLTSLVLLAGWITLVVLWTNYYLDMLILTDRRVIYFAQESLTRRSAYEWSVSDIRKIGIRVNTFAASFLNYGTLDIVARSGTRSVAIASIPDPEYVAAVILKQDDRYGELKETARKQQEFLKFMSHEIKGHLAKSKAAFASIVEGDYGAIPTPLQTMAHAALEDSQKGVDTVMSILQDADLAHGTTRIEKKPVDLSALVRRTVGEFQQAARQKNITLTASIEDNCIIAGDAEKLERHVVRNLIDNAIRYTPAGRVEVGLSRKDDVVHLTVADTGVGIAPHDMDKLFSEGGHGAHSKEVNPDSTGYGLFIAKQIVEAHGGRIEAHSPGPNQGSAFSVDLPATR